MSLESKDGRIRTEIGARSSTAREEDRRRMRQQPGMFFSSPVTSMQVPHK